MKSVCAAGRIGGASPSWMIAWPKPLAEQAAVGLREDRLRDLVAAADVLVVERSSNGCSHASTRFSIVGRIAYSDARADREQPERR